MTCPICFDNNNIKCFWKCNHKFCNTCINNWRTENHEGNCPICRESNIQGYRNIIRITKKYSKQLLRYIMYTYRFIKWVLKDLNDFIEEHVATNYDSSIQGITTQREYVTVGGSDMEFHTRNLRQRINIQRNNLH